MSEEAISYETFDAVAVSPLPFQRILKATEIDLERWAKMLAEKYCFGHNIVLASAEIEAYLRQAYYRGRADQHEEETK